MHSLSFIARSDPPEVDEAFFNSKEGIETNSGRNPSLASQSSILNPFLQKV